MRELGPQVPDLARVIERGGGEDVWCTMREAADVDQVAVHTFPPLQAAAGLRVVDGNVARRAARQQEVVAAVDAQRGERRVEAAGAREHLERLLARPRPRIVAQEADATGVGHSAQGYLRMVPHPREAEHLRALQDQRRPPRLLLRRLVDELVGVGNRDATASLTHEQHIRQRRVELELPRLLRGPQQLRGVVRHRALPRAVSGREAVPLWHRGGGPVADEGQREDRERVGDLGAEPRRAARRAHRQQRRLLRSGAGAQRR
mmetsp:Transcript_102109/g.264033  ORF Transcript_102109/g.264033 Transcript_102109/m.264033 type:complete len:261 (-) Transcript_102109:1472-2254(-)